MPTGYTAKVATGEFKSLKDYAEYCIPAFMIHFRDSPNANIREPLELSCYCADHLTELKKAYGDFLDLSDIAKKEAYHVHVDNMTKRYTERLDEIKTHLRNYNIMLEKARRFKAPTEKHNNFVEFLQTQIADSIKFDNHISIYEKYLEEIKNLTLSDFLDQTIRKFLADIQYYSEEAKKELESNENSVNWLASILEAIDNFEKEETL